ncbi:MAG: type II secretion system protein [Acidobacteriota bacterium]
MPRHVLNSKGKRSEQGFTLPEVIVAGGIMIVLCVGVLSVYSYVVKLNVGNNIRAHALTVLQREVEEFRSFRFVPGTTDARLNAGSYPNYKTGVLSVNPDGIIGNADDGIRFNISVTVDNDPSNSVGTAPDSISNADCRFKQIEITAVMQNPQTGWMSQLHTDVTIQRVRAN